MNWTKEDTECARARMASNSAVGYEPAMLAAIEERDAEIERQREVLRQDYIQSNTKLVEAHNATAKLEAEIRTLLHSRELDGAVIGNSIKSLEERDAEIVLLRAELAKDRNNLELAAATLEIQGAEIERLRAKHQGLRDAVKALRILVDWNRYPLASDRKRGMDLGEAFLAQWEAKVND